MSIPDPQAEYTMTVAEAAEALDLAPSYIRRLIAEGKLPAVKRAKVNFLRPADVEAWRNRPDMRRRNAQSPTNVRVFLDLDDPEELEDVDRNALWLDMAETYRKHLESLPSMEEALARLGAAPLDDPKVIGEQQEWLASYLAEISASGPVPESAVSALLGLQPTVDQLQQAEALMGDISLNSDALRNLLGSDSTLADYAYLAEWLVPPAPPSMLDQLGEIIAMNRQHLDELRREWDERDRRMLEWPPLNVMYTQQSSAAISTQRLTFPADSDAYVVSTEAAGRGDIAPILAAIKDLQRDVRDLVALQRRNNDDTHEMLETLDALASELPMQRKTVLRRLTQVIGERAVAAGFDEGMGQVTTERLAIILQAIENLPHK